MKGHKTRTVYYRRKRQDKTNYKKRLKMLQSDRPRLVVRRSSHDIVAQIVIYHNNGDKVVAAARGSELKKLGWNYNSRNTSSAYLTGLLIAKKSKEQKIGEAVLDLGLQKAITGSRLFALLKGAVDGGLSIPHSEEVVPSEDRIKGKHIEEYANKLKADQEAYNKKFSEYIKTGADPTSITKVFEETKNKITGA